MKTKQFFSFNKDILKQLKDLIDITHKSRQTI